MTSVLSLGSSFVFSLIRPPTSSTLFPYTTLFRSLVEGTARTRHNPVRGIMLELPPRPPPRRLDDLRNRRRDRKSTRLNSSHLGSSYAVFCLKKKSREERGCYAPRTCPRYGRRRRP